MWESQNSFERPGTCIAAGRGLCVWACRIYGSIEIIAGIGFCVTLCIWQQEGRWMRPLKQELSRGSTQCLHPHLLPAPAVVTQDRTSYKGAKAVCAPSCICLQRKGHCAVQPGQCQDRDYRSCPMS